MWLRRAINKSVDGWAEGHLKTHQQRRIALDPETVQILSEHQARCQARAEALGSELAADAFVFSGAPDGSTYPTPGALMQRYNRALLTLLWVLLILPWVTIHDRPGSGGQRPPRVRSAMAISESGLW